MVNEANIASNQCSMQRPRMLVERSTSTAGNSVREERNPNHICMLARVIRCSRKKEACNVVGSTEQSTSHSASQYAHSMPLPVLL
jgi:hypothetical protein